MTYTLKLDPITRDICFDDAGQLEILEGDDVTAQNVDNTLRTWQGEFFLDETHGTDYDRVMGKSGYEALSNDTAREMFREAILQEPQVRLITALEVVLDGSRILGADFTGELASGETIKREVETGWQKRPPIGD